MPRLPLVAVLRGGVNACVSAPVGLYRFAALAVAAPAPDAAAACADYDASTATTLRLFARNNWLKLRHLSLCCGNPGQPGC